MKREEKNQQTRRRIMDSALAEFSTQGYGASSINTICAAQGISKGIVYHYFETKDGLFLACVAECFQRLTAYIRENMPADTASGLEDYFSIRTKFFCSYPVYRRIFCEAVISPPVHLREEIRSCRHDFDRLNMQILEQLLTRFSLRPGISREEIIEFFRQFQDFISVHEQTPPGSGESFEAYEAHCHTALDILLYGVVDRKESNDG